MANEWNIPPKADTLESLPRSAFSELLNNSFDNPNKEMYSTFLRRKKSLNNEGWIDVENHCCGKLSQDNRGQICSQSQISA
jgi:hypothetical protein